MWPAVLPGQRRMKSLPAFSSSGIENQKSLPENKKRLCPHTWDKSESFCDTTQIDISCEMPARYTYHHTCPDG